MGTVSVVMGTVMFGYILCSIDTSFVEEPISRLTGTHIVTYTNKKGWVCYEHFAFESR